MPADCAVLCLACCSDVTVLVLDRPRHAKLISEIRAAGARIRMISDGDVGGAIETAKPEAPVDVMMGIGGTPEVSLRLSDWGLRLTGAGV